MQKPTGGVIMDTVLGLIRHAGNDGLFKAIEMSLLATVSGQPLHLHAEGLRGTGKTTIMRAVRRALPRIRRIKGCLYNCDPAYPQCPDHAGLAPEQVNRLGEEWVPMPFLEISHSAKVGTVVGSIDLGRLVNPARPEAALLPGTIPQAHRGIIFVDEINRLAETAPELADILLDVMGTKPGRVQIEETGLPPVELPVQVTVWAASNPDEDPGPLEEIRRQLSDRFDFVVYTDRPGEVSVVEEILSAAGNAGWHRPLSPRDETEAEIFRTRLTGRVPALRSVEVPDPIRWQIADLYSRFNVESLRAVQAIQLGMRLAACLDQRGEATHDDFARIVPLALRHRVDPETIKKVTTHLAGMNQKQDGAPAPPFAPSGKNRFPTISFGGAAVQTAPEPAEQEAGDRVAESGRPDAQSPRTDWPTQYPPRPRQDPQSPGWLTRTLAGLRRNLGLGAQEPARRPSGSLDGRQRLTDALPRSAGAPSPGRLYQRTDQQQPVAPGRSGLSHRSGPGAQGSAGSQQGTSPQVADPLKVNHVAPPNPARPISEIQAHELIRTEEELGRR